ncbi:MAG: DUF805 domain-containing protein [Bacteroidota bacterium]
MHNLFSVQGRLGRSTYQNRYLFSLGLLGLVFLVYELSVFVGMQTVAFYVVTASLALALVTLLTAAIRRLHDLDRPAWHLVLAFIPVYNLYLMLSLLCLKGEEEVNLYGFRPEPL